MPGSHGTPTGSVPVDVLDAQEIAGLLAEAAALAAELAGDPAAEAACAEAAPDRDGLADLHVALAIAAADLDDAIEGHAGLLRPLRPARRERGTARPHLEKQKRKRRGAPFPPAITGCYI